MSAKVHLHGRSEPAEIKEVLLPNQESGFRKLVFGRDIFQGAIRQPGGQQAHTGGVTAEGFRCKGVDLEIRNSHANGFEGSRRSQGSQALHFSPYQETKTTKAKKRFFGFVDQPLRGLAENMDSLTRRTTALLC